LIEYDYGEELQSHLIKNFPVNESYFFEDRPSLGLSFLLHKILPIPSCVEYIVKKNLGRV